MIDIGANLTHEYFRDRVGAVIDEAAMAGVEHIIVTGSDRRSSALAQNLSEDHAQLSFTAGIHPHNAVPATAPDIEALETFWRHPRCVAAGEIGLDYNRLYQSAARQRECFIAQLDRAKAHPAPLFLHLREADDDFIAIIREHARDREKVVHCYTGNSRTLSALLDLGAMIGITGWICDERRNHDLKGSLTHLPVDRIMIESDAPWLLPRTVENFRRIRHNHPRYLGYVLRELAKHKETDTAALARQVRANTIDFFGLGSGIGNAEARA